MTLAWNDASQVNTGYRITVDGQALLDVGDVSTLTHVPADYALHTYCVRAVAGATTSESACASGRRMAPTGPVVMSSFGLELTSSNTPAEVADGGGFGLNVDVNADDLVAGAPANGRGNAFLFTRSGSGWQQNQLLSSPTVGFNQFGQSVALTNTLAFVGAPHTGASIIVEGGWKLSQGFAGLDLCPNDPFNLCDYRSEIRQRVTYDDGGVYVYNLDSGAVEGLLRSNGYVPLFTPTEVEQCNLTSSDPNFCGRSDPSRVEYQYRYFWNFNNSVYAPPGPWTGYTGYTPNLVRSFAKLVAAEGRWAFVVAGKSTGAGDDLYIFERQGTGWVRRQTITGSLPIEGLTISGTTAAWTGGNAIGVHLYTLSGSTWTEQHTILNPTASRFGSSLALRDDQLAIGSAGGIHTYQRSGSNWSTDPVVLTPPQEVTSVAMSQQEGTYYLVAGKRARRRARDGQRGSVCLCPGNHRVDVPRRIAARQERRRPEQPRPRTQRRPRW